MTALRKNQGTPFEQFMSGRLKLATAIGGTTPVSPTPEQPSSARVVALPKTDPPTGDQLAAGQSGFGAHRSAASGDLFDLDVRIFEVVNEIGGDVDAVAHVVLDGLSEEEYLAVATRLVADRVRALTRTRPRATGDADRPRASSRWGAVAKNAEAIEVFRMVVFPRGVEKQLGDCTQREVDALATDAISAARRLRAISRLMTETGAERVREVPAEKISEVFA